MNQPTPMPPAKATAATAAAKAVLDAVEGAVIGKRESLELVLTGILAGGHVLLEDLPGLGKTLAARSFAQALGLPFKRAQFTPDLLPADLTGAEVFDQRTGEFVFRPGPVFTGLLLADEINRTPPKTQSALLEAMEERQVTVDGASRPLPDPFLVIATQNPIEFDGTYTLPEAQLDRFLLKAVMPLPAREVEVDVLRRHAGGFDTTDLTAMGLGAVADIPSLHRAQQDVAAVVAEDPVVQYIVDVCRATRRSPSLALGVSPRGAIALLRTSRAWAYLTGRDFVTPDDVKTMAPSTLSHRVRLTTEAELEGTQVEAVLAATLASVPVPR